jgi:hypothetical protein
MFNTAVKTRLAMIIRRQARVQEQVGKIKDPICIDCQAHLAAGKLKYSLLSYRSH